VSEEKSLELRVSVGQPLRFDQDVMAFDASKFKGKWICSNRSSASLNGQAGFRWEPISSPISFVSLDGCAVRS
jgi:hypothetical protein